MKITLEFEHPHELTALLIELASKIEQPEATCNEIEVREPMTQGEMMRALRPPIKNKQYEQCLEKTHAT